MRDYRFSLDVQIEDNIVDDIWFVSKDIGGKITIDLKDDNEILDLSNANVVAFFEKKDKTVTQKSISIIDIDNSVIDIDIVNSIIDIPGKVKCEIKVYQGENVTTFSPFNITVKKGIPTNEVVEGFNELDIIQEVRDNTKNITKNFDNINSLNTGLFDTTVALDEFSKETVKTFENVGSSLENLNLNIENLKDDTQENIDNIDKVFSENILNLYNDINLKLNSINKNIQSLNESKANIIVSLVEPNTDNLPIGTIWIKPNSENE